MTEIKKYKYRITELLHKLSVSDFNNALRYIPKQLAVAPQTFYNWRNILIDDNQDIPAEKVAVMEKMFGIMPGELANYTVEGRPLTAQPADLDTISKQLGLSKS